MENLYNYINYEQSNLDFNVIQYGYRQCTPNFGEPKHARQTYLLHYVYSGKGVFYSDDTRFNVSRDQAFLIHPNIGAVYIADNDDPFE